jgi:hypothetical protein
MSYYIYVTRKDDPLDETGPEITRAEWEAIVAADPDLTLADPPNKKAGDPTVYAMWADYYADGGEIWFELDWGNICINLHGWAIGEKIDPAILFKLRRFAAKTGGQIISELDERF